MTFKVIESVDNDECKAKDKVFRRRLERKGMVYYGYVLTGINHIPRPRKTWFLRYNPDNGQLYIAFTLKPKKTEVCVTLVRAPRRKDTDR